MAEYRLSPAAERDMEDMFDYTLARWGLAQAIRYTDQIEAACNDLAAYPNRAQSCDTIRPGYRRRAVGQHMIYLRTTDYGIVIIRILHQRMDTGRHL